jgi:hypothetical protein
MTNQLHRFRSEHKSQYAEQRQYGAQNPAIIQQDGLRHVSSPVS